MIKINEIKYYWGGRKSRNAIEIRDILKTTPRKVMYIGINEEGNPYVWSYDHLIGETVEIGKEQIKVEKIDEK